MSNEDVAREILEAHKNETMQIIGHEAEWFRGKQNALELRITAALAKKDEDAAKYKKLATGMAEALEYTTCDRRWCQPDRLCHRCAALAEFRDAVKEK